jgi:hypothetical protein
MADFNPALPIPVKWSVNENRFDNDGRNPRSLSIFIPVESAFAFAEYLITSADDSARRRTAKLWDYNEKCEVEVEGFYVNGKGRDGKEGSSFGSINPASPIPPKGHQSLSQSTDAEEISF